MENQTLCPPEEFEFPFPAYDIQTNFMRELYNVLEKKQLGIFESPTGTGKSLSIICGALRWLKDHNLRERSCLEDKIEKLQREIDALAKDSTDWLSSQGKELEIKRVLNQFKIDRNKIVDYDSKIDKIIARTKTKKNKQKTFKKVEKLDHLIQENEEDDVIDDIDANEESDGESDEDEYKPVKIFICSRTHSQISQFVGEIQKSPHGKEVRTVSLASRQNYCINPLVTKLKNVNLINERCVDMQKNKSKATKKDEDGKLLKKKRGESCKCPYYKQTNIDELRDEALTDIHDVEDLVVTGKKLNACPYYASRKAAEDSQVILVPYNTILHKATRQANGIKLKNNVVIIDEAHNLLEAFAQMHSSVLKCNQIVYAQQQLKNYKARYSTRFSAYNLLCINQLLFIINKLKLFIETCTDQTKQSTEVFTISDFVTRCEIDNYNMFKLIKFVKNSKLSQKLHSFFMKNPDALVDKEPKKKGVKEFLSSIENKRLNKNVEVVPVVSTNKPTISNPMLAVLSFMESLTYSYEDGRILFYKDADVDSRKFQFLLLNPASQFTDIVKDARAVVVAGGTMKPNVEFTDRLYKAAGADAKRIVEFSCDHIISKDNILPVIMTAGQNNENLLFNYENRFSMGNSIKSVIEKVCKTVPGGVVIFFPSYKYESWIWEQIKNMSFGRPVFREPQDSGSVESVLNSYASSINKDRTTGALLLSVVGGKLSEGLNFSDDLGRCVIVVGMPYPNIFAPDLKEKMAYVEKVEGSGCGQKFYQNLCMKAVNQCIGRAVRHQNDYATVILLDERYNRTATKNSLPDWIKRCLRTCTFQETFDLFGSFFRQKTV